MKKQHGTVIASNATGPIIERTAQGVREVWRVASEGQVTSIATSASSVAAMDKAVVIYDTTLRRLANR